MPSPDVKPYRALYAQRIDQLRTSQHTLLDVVEEHAKGKRSAQEVEQAIGLARRVLKATDIWTRYLDPVSYRLLNGPLPVEWETEVFEKFEKPYRREGAGVTLAYLLLQEDPADTAGLRELVTRSLYAVDAYMADSITEQLNTPDHFHFCNRLFVLDLAAIYTTGFECPDTSAVIPELSAMLHDTRAIMTAYDDTWPQFALDDEYWTLYDRMRQFVDAQPQAYSAFDHFTFIRSYVGRLFTLCQRAIREHGMTSVSYMDYALNDQAESIFAKHLYVAQDRKGVFRDITDPTVLAQVREVGRSLFFDPILSGNNARSCATCHKPGMLFTDTTMATAATFDRTGLLQRNAPTLVNADLNHLLMLDGAHTTLQEQAKGVMVDPKEMGADLKGVLEKVMSCPDHRTALTRLAQFTPAYPEVSVDHIVSSLTFYYTSFSDQRSRFDRVMDRHEGPDADVRDGFNLFMSRAQCATCHFVPHFNGVKPPYIGTEFEVIGVPQDTGYNALSTDRGRYDVNPAPETRNAFRTPGLRNVAHTAPYMHNGIFRSLEQVIELYNNGGAQGHGLALDNQTAATDSLHLSTEDTRRIIAFLNTLSEDLPVDPGPVSLPTCRNKELNARRAGGEY